LQHVIWLEEHGSITRWQLAADTAGITADGAVGKPCNKPICWLCFQHII